MKCALPAALLFLFSIPPAFAQDAAPETPSDSVTWYAANYTKFKPGTADAARKIIRDHFWPVDKEIGREIIAFDFFTGEWDHVVYFPMRGGPAELALGVTPLDQRWREAFFRREGGKEKAEALERRFGEMVLREKTELATKRGR